MSVSVVLTDIDIGPYPTMVRSILGRGAWPHHNIVFEFRDPCVYRVLETKLAATYMSMGAYLELDRWGTK